MKLSRRKFVHLAAGGLALPAASRFARAQTPLAERLADYADRLRFEDIDAATLERVKAHVIDTIGCGIAAFDEPPVPVCPDLALATPGGPSALPRPTPPP